MKNKLEALCIKRFSPRFVRSKRTCLFTFFTLVYSFRPSITFLSFFWLLTFSSIFSFVYCLPFVSRFTPCESCSPCLAVHQSHLWFSFWHCTQREPAKYVVQYDQSIKIWCLFFIYKCSNFKGTIFFRIYINLQKFRKNKLRARPLNFLRMN